MTNTNYDITPIMLKMKLPTDEWKNHTLTIEKIYNLTASYMALLDNSEINVINHKLLNDPLILELSSKIRKLSKTLKTENWAELRSALKEVLFRKYLIVSEVAFTHIPGTPQYEAKMNTENKLERVTGRRGQQ